MTPHPALFIESIANCKPCGAKARTFCRSSSAMKVVTAVNSCQFTCRTKRKGVPGRGHPFVISDFLREILLCVWRLRRLGRGVSALISLLSCKPHRVQDRRKRLIVTAVRGLRSDADEIEQPSGRSTVTTQSVSWPPAGEMLLRYAERPGWPFKRRRSPCRVIFMLGFDF